MSSLSEDPLGLLVASDEEKVRQRGRDCCWGSFTGACEVSFIRVPAADTIEVAVLEDVSGKFGDLGGLLMSGLRFRGVGAF